MDKAYNELVGPAENLQKYPDNFELDLFIHDKDTIQNLLSVKIAEKPVVKTTTVTVTKHWVEKPGTSAVVNLLADGDKVGSATLNAENNWTYTFKDLPKFKDYQVAEKEIIYTVTEDKIEGYDTVISGDAQKGYIITNTQKGANHHDNNKPKTLETGDTGASVPYMLTLALAAAATLVVLRKKTND